MITFILLIFFLALAIVFGVVAYSANNRNRAGQAEVAKPAKRSAPETRPMAHN